METEFKQEWFEMAETRKRVLDKGVWIPLRASKVIQNAESYGDRGHVNDFFGAGSVAVPVEKRAEAMKLNWDELGLMRDHGPNTEKGKYIPSDVYTSFGEKVSGVPLVLSQRGNMDEHGEWHLHPDLIIALELKREGDKWVAMNEGYVEVVRLQRDSADKPVLLEIRAEYLKDYLCARGMLLAVAQFRERRAILENADHIKWPEGAANEKANGQEWTGHVTPIHEGSGEPYGSSWAVIHSGRTDVDPEEEVPEFGSPGDKDIKTKSWTKKTEGDKLFSVSGKLWRTEVVEPAAKSPRVRGDQEQSAISFIVDGEGKKLAGDKLMDKSRWLWFKPEVIQALCHYRGSRLSWYTLETGSVTAAPGHPVHFGVNKMGLVNVYAKDIAMLPLWQQQIWAGFNVSPEGGVSDELLASQMKAEPAATKPPEEFLPRGLEAMNEVAKVKLGRAIIRPHDALPELFKNAHRFRAIDQAGLLSLAKDLARLTADSIDTSELQKVVAPPQGDKWGSLKSLEKVLATRMGDEAARSLMGPLHGVYNLRHADAHLPKSDLDEAMALVGVDQSQPFVIQGRQMLHTCVSCLYGIAKVLHEKF